MSCNYQGYEFGAGSYPDSVCIDGQLFDADACDGQGNLYEPLEYVPCPMCHRADAIDYWSERNQLRGLTALEARKAARKLVTDIRQQRGLSK